MATPVSNAVLAEYEYQSYLSDIESLHRSPLIRVNTSVLYSYYLPIHRHNGVDGYYCCCCCFCCCYDDDDDDDEFDNNINEEMKIIIIVTIKDSGIK